MLITGALLDMSVGVLLLASRPRIGWTAGFATAAAAAIAIAAPRLDPALLASGVFRTGNSSRERKATFHADGRTATVSGFRYPDSELLVLATNGKPDASLGPSWFRPCDSTVERRPILV